MPDILDEISEKDLQNLVSVVRKIKKKEDEKPKRKRSDGIIRTPYSVKQLKNLFSVISNAKIALIVFIALRTGMRQAEVLSLKLSEIEWELNRIKKPRTKGGRPRVYYLDPKAINILRKWVMLLGDTEYVFPSQRGRNGCLHNQGFYCEFKKYLKKAGLWIVDKNQEGKVKQHVYVFHSLRTTFCSLLVNSGVPVFVAKELMGHSKIATTERHYAFLGDVTLKKELDRVFGHGRNKQVKQWAKEELKRKDEHITTFNQRFDDEPEQIISRDPLHELQLRLVRGEISVAEFNQKGGAIKSMIGGDK